MLKTTKWGRQNNMFMKCPLFQHQSFSKEPYSSCRYAGTLRLVQTVQWFMDKEIIQLVLLTIALKKITPDSENSNTSWASEIQYTYHSIQNIVLITFLYDNIYRFELMFSCGMSWFNLHATEYSALCVV